MDLWDGGLHTSLVGDTKEEWANRRGRAPSGGEEEDEAVERNYHDTVLYGKLRQVVRRSTDREGVIFSCVQALGQA